MERVNLNFVIDEIVDLLLLNKSVLLVSDNLNYNEIIFELKESFEDVPLYNFNFVQTNNLITVKGHSKLYDKVIVYMSSEEETETAKTVLEKEIIVF